MTTVTAPAPASARAEVSHLIDLVGHQVAAAFEVGGVIWEMAAPLLRGLVGDDVLAAPGVVVTRALGKALTRHAAALERTSEGDQRLADAMAAELRATSRGLASLLEGPSPVLGA